MIVSLGALRPDDWTQFAVGTAVAVAVATALNYFVPRLYPWGGDETEPAKGDSTIVQFSA